MELEFHFGFPILDLDFQLFYFAFIWYGFQKIGFPIIFFAITIRKNWKFKLEIGNRSEAKKNQEQEKYKRESTLSIQVT